MPIAGLRATPPGPEYHPSTQPDCTKRKLDEMAEVPRRTADHRVMARPPFLAHRCGLDT